MRETTLAAIIVPIAMVLACICAGCSRPPDLDWEFEAVLPQGATMDERMAMENVLLSNGYKRVTFTERQIHTRAIIIKATKAEAGAKEQGGQHE